MANKKITDVDIVSTINDTDYLFINQNSTLKQIQKTNAIKDVEIDSTLSVSGQAADAKITGNKISELKSDIENLQSSGSGLTDTEKNLILTLLQNTVFTSDQSGNIEALYNLFNNTIVEVTGIVLSASSLSITTADSKTLNATLRPSGATGTVVWSSSDNSVATVSQTGMVTPVSNGSCIITASVGESIFASCTVNVDLSNVVDITQDGTTLIISKAKTVTQDGSTLLIA